MATAYDLNGNPITGESAPAYDLDGKPVSSTPSHGPGVGGMKPSTTPAASAPEQTGYGMPRLTSGMAELGLAGPVEGLAPGHGGPGYMRGIHNTLVGAGELAAPLALPTSVEAIPAFAGRTALGAMGAGAGHVAGRLMGASPEAEDLMGDATGAAAGMVGGPVGRLAGRIIGNPRVRSAFMENIPFVGKWASAIHDSLQPHAPEPFTPNPNISRNMRFSPSPETGTQAPGPRSVTPAVRPSERVFAGPEVPAVPPTFEPFRPNPNIARLNRGVPSAGSSAGSASPQNMPVRTTPSRFTSPTDFATRQSVPQGVPSGTASGTAVPGNGQPYVGPTSFNAAPKVTPGAIPELMRQQRLQSGDTAPASVILDPSGRPIATEPRTFANGGIKNNTRRR